MGGCWAAREERVDQIDPDGALGIRKYFESQAIPGTKLTVDEYYGHIFERSVPGLPERAAEEGLTPLQFMRRYGAYEVRKKTGPQHEEKVPAAELTDPRTDARGRVFTKSPKPDAGVATNLAPVPTPDPDAEGRRPAGVDVDGAVLRGFPTPSGRLEFFSKTLHDWGWGEAAIPAYMKSHVHPENLAPGEMPLIPTFRLPTQVHTRSANSKWLDEIAHTNPLWIHPKDATRFGLSTGDLARVVTRIGHFVVKAWVTEGIRPGVLACSHHMGRWKVGEEGQRQLMTTVELGRSGSAWTLRKKTGIAPYPSSDADTGRIWWTEGGVHQNLTFPVQPDPLSGMHCWHQAVLAKAEPGDVFGDVSVDTARSRAVYAEWMAKTRPAATHSPDGTRRPYWLMRPLKPGRDVYRLPSR